MNTKRFLIIVVLVGLLVSLFALITMTKSTPVKAEVQAEAPKLILVDEPAIRLQSGEIHFSDSNSPDFSPHAANTLKPDSEAACLSDENAKPRRYGGCVE